MYQVQEMDLIEGTCKLTYHSTLQEALGKRETLLEKFQQTPWPTRTVRTSPYQVLVFDEMGAKELQASFTVRSQKYGSVPGAPKA